MIWNTPYPLISLQSVEHSPAIHPQSHGFTSHSCDGVMTQGTSVHSCSYGSRQDMGYNRNYIWSHCGNHCIYSSFQFPSEVLLRVERKFTIPHYLILGFHIIEFFRTNVLVCQQMSTMVLYVHIDRSNFHQIFLKITSFKSFYTNYSDIKTRSSRRLKVCITITEKYALLHTYNK